MQDLTPAYLSALATQIGALSAFLGGFAATYLGTLLALGHRTRSAGVAIGFAVASSVGFVVAVVATTLLIATLHPDAPAGAPGPMTARVAMGAGFGIGLYSLLFSLAISGWSRSRATGWTTTVAGAVGIITVTMLLAGGKA